MAILYPMVIAHRLESQYLIGTDIENGRILDMDTNDCFPEDSIQSILRFGYWEEYTGDQSAIIHKYNKLK